MTAKFIDTIDMYDAVQGSTLRIDRLNEEELILSLRPNDGAPVELVMHQGDAVVLADRLMRLATRSHHRIEVATDDSYPEY